MTALPTELTGGHHLAQQGWCAERVAECDAHVVEDGQQGVEPHAIRELQRAHRMVVSELHRRIEVLGGSHALLERAYAFAHEQRAEPRGHEPRQIPDLDRLLAERAAECERATERRLAGLDRAHDLDESHGRYRVEEVRADDLAWAPTRGTQHLDRQAAGVRREHRVAPDGRAEPLEDRALQLEVLGDGLDHDRSTRG